MAASDLIFRIVEKYIWLWPIIGTGIGVVVLNRQGAKVFKDDEEELQRFSDYNRRLGFWLGFPWVVMGVCCTIGSVDTVFAFLRPRDGNFWVLLWWLSAFLVLARTFYWVYVGEGANQIAKYQVVWYAHDGKSASPKSPLKIKVWFGLGLVATLIAAIAVWLMDFPVSDFVD